MSHLQHPPVDILLHLLSHSHILAIPWEALWIPVLSALIIACLGSGIWSIRSRARNTRNATLETELLDRRLNDMVRASDERLRARLNAELERTRASHDQRSGEEWGRLMTGLNNGFRQLEERLLEAEKQFAPDHARTAARLNEAMVVIQQAGLAVARANARRSGPRGH